MNKDTLYEVAVSAVKSLAKDRSMNATFPADAIWDYAEKPIPSLMRPGVAIWLAKEGYIALTGNLTSAESEKRAGSPTREYRIGPKISPVAARPSRTATSTANISEALTRLA